MLFTRWSARSALVALVLSAAPALTMSPVGAAPADTASPDAATAATGVAKPKTKKAKSWLSVTGPDAFSPNGDGRHDTARFKVKVKKRANVTVRVVRAGKVVRGPVKLGKRKAGSTKSWTWDGKNSKGKRVADAYFYGRKGYEIKVAARSLKTGKRVVGRHGVGVDTLADMTPGTRLVASDDTVYPRTAVTRDSIFFYTDDGVYDGDLDRKGAATLVIRSVKGKKLTEITSDRWERDPGGGFAHAEWDGTYEKSHPLNGGWFAGDVTAQLRVEDAVGNIARTPPITIHVSAKRLVPKTASVTIAPQQTLYTPTAYDCREVCVSPCATVVPSERADVPLGLSYRSCSSDPAVARHFLYVPDDAVRGGVPVSLTMRGRPTVTGESDTALLTVGGIVVRSEASQDETTTTASRTYDFDPIQWSNPMVWMVQTRDGDSYDVAEFDITYAYLVVGD